MTQKSFTIGALAKKAGVNVETIRFYQRRRLLVEPVKPFKGVRHYSERDVQRVRFIKERARNNLGKFNISPVEGWQHNSIAQDDHQTKCA